MLNKKTIMVLLLLFVFGSSIFIGTRLEKRKFNKEIELSSKKVNTQITNKENKTVKTVKVEEKIPKNNLVRKVWTGSIENIFFHPLISNTKVAFKGDWRTNDFDDWFITVNEFNKILESLYKNNYVLVDINNIYEEYEEKGEKRIRRKKLLVPDGKKPLILSIDDLSYNTGMRGGTSDKVILDSRGEIATLIKEDNGQDKIVYDKGIIPIVETFIKSHPDFSLDGARGIIALTGYEGILGYSTNFESPNYKDERKKAKEVVDKLKVNGWTFASHSYGHNDMTKISLDKLKRDADKWEKEVASIVGTTPIFIYPHGFSVNYKDAKFKYLQSKGFKIFYSVGKEPYEKILKDTCAVLGDRMAVDGIALRNKRQRFIKFYDAKEVIDLNVRPKREVRFE